MLDGQDTFPGGRAEAELLHELRSLVERRGAFESVTIEVQKSAQGARAEPAANTICVPFDAFGLRLVLTARYRGRPAPPQAELARIGDLCAMFAHSAERLRDAAQGESRLAALWELTARALSSQRDTQDVTLELLTAGGAELEAGAAFLARRTADGVQITFSCGELPGDAQDLADEVLANDAAGESDRWIGAPLRAGDEPYALCFSLERPRAQPCRQRDREYVALLASVLGRTLERRATLQQIEYLQDHDQLTALPHRNRFHARLSELLKSGGPMDSIAVLIVDTDRFRQVVDEHGPDAGDEVVAELARRIRLAKSEEHELFRYRSDSFALIVHGPRALTDVHYLAERCISGVALPLKIDGHETRITASIGIAIYPSDGHDVSALAIAATTAMRRAKRAGPGQFRFYNELLDERFGRRRLFAEELREAVHKNELVLYYQPIVGLQTRRVIGAEALLRWHHPRRGIVGATEFVHIAEESDLINDIGTWVLHHAAAQAKAWSDAGTPLVVAINLSARQFQDAGLLAETEGALKSSGVASHLLEFEVTESIAMHDPDAAAYTLGCFRDLGLRVALDDFGTGHSSLAYLKRFPIDIIKLDQAFVAGLPDEPADAAIANAVVALASSMQCEVRAEGIELPAQEEYLRGIGVASAQGFLIAPPLMPHSFERWLQGFARTG